MESPTTGEKFLGKSLSLLWSVKFCNNVEQGYREKEGLIKQHLLPLQHSRAGESRPSKWREDEGSLSKATPQTEALKLSTFLSGCF